MKDSQLPAVSVIIPTCSGHLTIGDAVRSVLQCDYPHFEVLVVSNGADTATTVALEELPPQVRVIHSERNLGFSGGNNLGLTQAQGEIIILLNDDAEVRPDWMGNLVRGLLNHPQAGLAGSLMLESDGRTIQQSGSYFLRACLNQHMDKNKPFEEAPKQPVERDYLMGAAIAVRRELLQSLGGLSECYYPGYYEDTELCYRTRALGYKVILIPSAVVIHREKQTLADSPEYYRIYHRHRWLFILRNLPLSEIILNLGRELRWIWDITRWKDFRHHRALVHAYLYNLRRLPETLRERRRWRKHRTQYAG